MIKIEHLKVMNMKAAIRGMRNPWDSWNKSDSFADEYEIGCEPCSFFEHKDKCDKNCPDFFIGEKDLELMKKLYKGGPVHAKYLRQIFVSFDVVAPLYWWKEMDQYRIGVTSNSTSTMHTLAKRDLTLNDFSHEHLTSDSREVLIKLIDWINADRRSYINSDNDKLYWWQMIQLLPSSYNQRRTLSMNYENLTNIIKWRKEHKLDEWKSFCDFMLDNAPYLKEIMGE